MLETGMEIGNVPCGIGHIKPAENSVDSLLVRSGTALMKVTGLNGKPTSYQPVKQ